MSSRVDTIWEFDAIGTHWSIETEHALAQEVRDAVSETIDAFDRVWSRFRDDSVVSFLAANGGEAVLPNDADEMLSMFAEMSDATDGAVNPLIGASLEALGYDARYSLHAGEATAAPSEWRGILGWHAGALVLARPAVIDVGALGKGRLVDLVAAAVGSAGGGLVIDAAGDILVKGIPQRIGLEHPYDTSRVIGVWQIDDGALCASATNRRAWGDGLHHVLDGRTGMPVRTIAATWAVAPTAMRADAASTALFFEGGPELAHRWGVQWVRMTTDGAVEWSHGFTGELFR
ncbi:hypothetical protein GCM10009808_13710 [Microbacterium sediminicola]|uniref:FAD:protein FMN transferase n=1 Tax=Microbacterium sediminicola TaxID=415210 RepID=A0ABN2I2U2_9MICO